MEDLNESLGTFMSKESSFGLALASSSFTVPDENPAFVYSEFGEGDCGEPLEAQHIRFDFTPTDDDDDYSQKKCCEFWKYINSRNDLKHLMVLPEPTTSVTKSPEVASVQKLTTTEPVTKPKTAVSMLQFADQKGLIDRIFEAKMPQSRCTLGSKDYEIGPAAQTLKCGCLEPCIVCPNAPAAAAQALTKEMGVWDINHPKSMEPPGHPPSLQSQSDY